MYYPWQYSQWAVLQNMLKKDCLPSALLLAGQKGLGKKDFAFSFANYLLCEKAQAFVCGGCRGCQLFSAGTHPDFSYVSFFGNSQVIKIDQIRTVVDEVHKTPYAKRHIVIVNPAPAVTRSGANALLKTLEEPPGETLFILIQDHGTFLLPTLQSRCFRIPFSCQARVEILKWLQSKTLVSSDYLSQALVLSAGAPLHALQWIEEDYHKVLNGLLECLKNLVTGQATAWESVANVLDKNVGDILSLCYFIISDVLRVREDLSSVLFSEPGAVNILLELSHKCSMEHWFSMLSKIQKLCAWVKNGSNLTPQGVLELLFLALAQDETCFR